MDIPTLLESIEKNKYLPTPKTERIFTGILESNDFRQIGVAVLRSLINFADLLPTHSVLEIGSGIGRIAVPLTQYLDKGEYYGIEIVMDGVAWCHENVTQYYGNFRFIHLDIYNEWYNPTGRGTVKDVRLPFEEKHFDVVFLCSVFTHLNLSDMEAYLDEIHRVLKEGGMLWSTWFLIDREARKSIKKNTAAWKFFLDEGPDFYLDDKRSTYVVGYDHDYVLNIFKKKDFNIDRINYGLWCRREIEFGGRQDVIVAKKGGL